jgi:hypothetical protein
MTSFELATRCSQVEASSSKFLGHLQIIWQKLRKESSVTSMSWSWVTRQVPMTTMPKNAKHIKQWAPKCKHTVFCHIVWRRHVEQGKGRYQVAAYAICHFSHSSSTESTCVREFISIYLQLSLVTDWWGFPLPKDRKDVSTSSVSSFNQNSVVGFWKRSYQHIRRIDYIDLKIRITEVGLWQYTQRSRGSNLVAWQSLELSKIRQVLSFQAWSS